MPLSLWIFALTGLVMINIYTDGLYLSYAVQYYDPRYFRMGVVFCIGILIYLFVVRFPRFMCIYLIRLMDWIRIWPTGSGGSMRRSQIPTSTHVDSKTTAFYPQTDKVIDASIEKPDANTFTGKMAYAIRRLTESAKVPTGKRTVSETKKKFVAAQQQWKCHTCGCILPAWFEVDHIQRVERGGSNHPDNLVALCRDCHGKKTALENL